eukprot:SAG22_NODE_1695_length_3796_cov_3.361915_3_plen_188_part_00
MIGTLWKLCICHIIYIISNNVRGERGPNPAGPAQLVRWHHASMRPDFSPTHTHTHLRFRWDAARAEVLRVRGDQAAPPDSGTPVAHYKGHEGTGRLLPNGTAPYDNGTSYPQSTFDLPSLPAKDDAFLDLVDHPKLLPLLAAVCGAGGLSSADAAPADSPYHGIVRCGGMSGRVVPAEANEQGYLSW